MFLQVAESYVVDLQNSKFCTQYEGAHKGAVFHKPTQNVENSEKWGKAGAEPKAQSCVAL